MADPFPHVEVAVAVITRGNRVLVVYNPLWGSFTLPMTKRRQWDDPTTTGGTKHEEWRDAAARAAAEVLGRTFTAKELPEEADLGPVEFQQSDRTGEYKRYHFQVFKITLAEDVKLVDGTIAALLSRVEILDKKRAPVSPTARLLLKRLGPI